VTIACATIGSEIRYTLDGSTPVIESPLYNGPIIIVSNTTVYAKAFKPGLTDSSLASATYTLNYMLTVIGGSGGGMFGPGAAVAITLDATPPGQVVGGWTVLPSGTSLGTAFDTRQTMTSLVMPAAHVTLTAAFRPPVTIYADASRPDDSGDGLSWSTAKRTLQSAVYTAGEGGNGASDIILATNGVYNAGGAVTPGYSLSNRVVIAKEVAVRSVNGASVTVIEGSGTNNFNTANAMRCVYLSKGVLEGFTLRKGSTRWNMMFDGDSFGGGVYMESPSLVLRNCVISGNRAQFGGGAHWGTLNNCLLTDNTATDYGGGAGFCTLNSTTIVGNTAGRRGGGVYNGNDVFGVYNCIIWNNRRDSGLIDDCYFLSWNVYYSCASELSAINGNINVNPQFVDASNGNYRLQPTSPCIDKGSNTYASDLPDLDGHVRIIDGDANITNTVDMGAYEYGSWHAVAAPEFVPWHVTSFIGTLAVFISCATAGSEIRYTVDGTDPTTNSSLYTASLSLNGTTTVKAKAYRTGLPESVTVTATFTKQTVATPTFSPSSATSFTGTLSVAISCATAGAEIRYTLDETEPTSSSALYTSPFSLSATTTIRAKAFKAGMTASAVAAMRVTQQPTETPVISPPSTTVFTNDLVVSVSCVNPGARIRYTTDGVDPTGSSILYMGAFTLSATATVKARAFFAGLADSGVAEATYRKVKTLYVDAGRPDDSGDGLSWGTAKQTIQSGIDAAVEGDTVLVTNGIYNVGCSVMPGQSLSNRVIIAKDLTLCSVNGATETIIEGSGTNYYGTAGAMRCVYITKGILDGFTLRGGTSLSGAYNVNYYGGGVYSAGGVLKHCVLSGNKAYNGGGSYESVLYDCWVTDNVAMNDGGGSCGGTLNNVILLRNSAKYGAGSLGGTLYNSLLVGNTASSSGGGTHNSVLYNCTVSQNSAGNGGGIYSDSSRYPFNCIIWNNRLSSGATNDCNSSVYAYNTCASGIAVTSGNINVDPLFVNPGNGDYRLQANSPCIDKGSNTYAPNLTDIDGNARVFDGDANGINTVDMGAYEFASSPGVAMPVIIPPNGTFFLGSVVAQISCEAVDATIRYTLDGTEPTTNSMVYAGPLSLMNTTTIKSKAFKSGLPDSLTVGAVLTRQAVATPVFTPVAGTLFINALAVTVTCSTASSEIRYTLDGTTPIPTSSLYTGPIILTTNTTVNAKAFKLGMDDSATASASYSLQPVATPVFLPPAGWPCETTLAVTTTCATAGATMRYTVDGTEPSLSSPVYASPIIINATTTIKVKAYKQGYPDSVTATAMYPKAIPISEAVDNLSLTFTMLGNLPWYGETGGTAHDGIDAARSGLITPGQQSWMETVVYGTGTISFWWKITSGSGYGNLSFFIDRGFQSSISRDVNWQQRTYTLGNGYHTLMWYYRRNASSTTVPDGSWVDQIVWSPTVQRTARSTPYQWLDDYRLVGGGDYEAADMLDSDGDGYKAWEEYVAGTDPTNSLSVFRAKIDEWGGQRRVSWTPDLTGAVPSRVYSVFGTGTLLDGFPSTPATNVPAGTPISAQSLEPYRFFKVGVGIQQ